MNKNSKKEKSTKTIVIVFISVIIISGLAGYFSAGFITKLSRNKDFTDTIKDVLHYIGIGILPISGIINLICFIISFSLFSKQKKKFKNYNGGNEDILESIDHKLSVPLNIASIMIIFNYLFFSINMYTSVFSDLSKDIKILYFYIGTLIFILSFVWETLIQGFIISLEKQVNPEKRGNILDTGFRKDWVDSCDEYEKELIYKSSYDSFIATNGVCMVLWIVSLLGMLIFKTGLFATVLITILWIVCQGSYLSAAAKYEKKNR